MDAEEVDQRVTETVREVMLESERQLLQEMNSLMQKISEQNCSWNEEQLLKISSIVARGRCQNLKKKKKSNEAQYKLNS